MMALLSSLLSLLDRLWATWEADKLRRQGRQEAEKEAADENQRQRDLAHRAVVVDDPDRSDRLRKRFDDNAGD